MTSIHYRRDVDGLRAVAIVLVVLYHLKIPGFGGGFIGVDIFFAISGFLIFSILNREVETARRVDWVGFFARRIRRLLPEATVVIVVIMAVSPFVLLPIGEQQALAKTGISGALWLANVYFWRFGGNYFSPATERQPLLHLWSLGVEEQFYIVVPVMFLMAAWMARRFGLAWRRSVFILLAVAGVLSLSAAVWAMHAHAVASYYILPTRAYEFAIGALAALWLVRQKSRKVSFSPVVVSVGSLLGLVGIGISVAIAAEEKRFPGYWALLPTISASLLLLFGASSRRNVVDKCLEARPIVYLGKMSYGWYLWHFPLLVLWRELWLFETSLWAEVAVVCVALVPAAIGYRAVLRFRNQLRVRDHAKRSSATSSSYRYGAAAVLGTVLVSGVMGAQAKYVGSKTPEMAALFAQLNDYYLPAKGCFLPDPELPGLLPECEFGNRDGSVTIVLWGDSHANHWVPALDPTFRSLDIRGVERVRAACPPTTNHMPLFRNYPFAECGGFSDQVIEDLAAKKRERPVAVILSARWGIYMGIEPLSIATQNLFDAVGHGAMEATLQRVVAQLHAMDIPTGIILQAPEMRLSVPVCLRRLAPEKCTVPVGEQIAYLSEPKQTITAIAAAWAAPVIDPVPALCEMGRCRIERDGIPLYHDDNHLSTAGARTLSPFLTDFVRELKQAAITR